MRFNLFCFQWYLNDLCSLFLSNKFPMDCERLFYFSHEESGQELLHLDTILALKVLETMVSLRPVEW